MTRRTFFGLMTLSIIFCFLCTAASALNDSEPADSTASTIPSEQSTLEPVSTPSPMPQPTLMKRGSRGEDVQILQQKLLEYGFTTEEPDGIFSSKTEDALKKFQTYWHDTVHATKSPWEGSSKPFLADIPLKAATPEEDFSLPLRNSPLSGDSSDSDGEEAPFEPSGVLEDEQRALLLGDDFSVYQKELTYGASGAEVERLQTRLSGLGYMDGNITGVLGYQTYNALKYFQQTNNLSVGGRSDESTQLLLYSPEAKPSDTTIYQYYLIIDTNAQRVYAYEWDGAEYKTLSRIMICSTGADATPTPKGVFVSEGPAAKWCYFPIYGCWAQYAYRIEGSIFFHSVLYEEANEATLKKASVDKLGTKASHGCVRLSLEDAKWIYDNCKAGTIVEVI